MHDALIGYSGYVGTTLLRQRPFQKLYRSTNISEIRDQEFVNVVCAGASAQKWIANRAPDEDKEKIERLMNNLKTVQCSRFILISTVDVFNRPIAVDETTHVDVTGLHPYGLHRRMLEQFAEETFSDCLIVRLAGLVGPGLRKNVIFDLLNDNNLQAVDSRAVFQFYPMVNLWYDIDVAIRHRLNLVHLTAEPISVAEVAQAGFGRRFDQKQASVPACYDMRSQYGQTMGGKGHYQYSKRETIQAIRAYAQSEPRQLKEEGDKLS